MRAKLIKLKINYIPNCSLCKWNCTDEWVDEGHKLKMPVCSAQGYRQSVKVYNNGLCKKLYDCEVKKGIEFHNSFGDRHYPDDVRQKGDKQ